MKKMSAGILLYRMKNDALECFLVHPGGLFWAKKDEGAWSIPKGEYEEGEASLDAAQREFKEETGFDIPLETCVSLGEAVQKSGKIITAFACRGDCDPEYMKSNTFQMEWPPRSGMMEEFPECDRGQWFPLEDAIIKINPGQAGFIDTLRSILSV